VITVPSAETESITFFSLSPMDALPPVVAIIISLPGFQLTPFFNVISVSPIAAVSARYVQVIGMNSPWRSRVPSLTPIVLHP